MDSVDWKKQEKTEEEGQADVEDFDQVSNETKHRMDLIVVTPRKPNWIIGEQINYCNGFKRGTNRWSPHVNFIFGNQWWIFEDRDLVQSQHLHHPIVRSYIQAGFKQQKKQCLKSTWRKRLSKLTSHVMKMEIKRKLEVCAIDFRPRRTLTELVDRVLSFCARVLSKTGRVDASQIMGRPALWAQSTSPVGGVN